MLLGLLNFVNLRAFDFSMSVFKIIQALYLVLPIALILLGISLMNHKPEIVQVTREETVPAGSGNIPSVGDWMLIYLLLIIPLVNIILLIVWAVDNNNRVRKNWALATILWTVIIIVITLILFATGLSYIL